MGTIELDTPFCQEIPVKAFLVAVGVLLVLLGLHWVGQGTGIFVWPANPVMDDHIEWAYYGGGACIVGVLLIWISSRRARTTSE